MKKIIYLIILFFFMTYNFSFSKEIFLSLKKEKVNVRYGPGFDYPIKYVYNKLNLPIKLIDKKDNFRRIIDQKKNSGWIHVSQLKKANSIIILEDKILFLKPSIFSKPISLIKEGRLLLIKKCNNQWCRVKSGDYLGWIITDNVWGTLK